jgi:hypothetical protein
MTFAGLVKLEELDLSSNRLNHNLSHNRIETIEMHTFRNLTRLNELWLDYNGGLIVNKTSGLFVGLAELKDLHITEAGFSLNK